ncbi:MAG: hypothetical protein KAJ40_08680 [Alphaproteobacteria bacterium]|nr:hypothetical protein [Alphaproteobacteria bacterium]
MTMTGIILSIVISGIISFFVSVKFLRNRMGLGIAIMFFVPIISCGVYVYLTAPRFNPPIEFSPVPFDKEAMKAMPLPPDITHFIETLEDQLNTPPEK